jgi:hypothetical protein
MERIELLWELAERERLVRWSALVTLGLLWLTVAWLSPFPLVAALGLVGAVYVIRRRRGDHLYTPADDEIDML